MSGIGTSTRLAALTASAGAKLMKLTLVALVVSLLLGNGVALASGILFVGSDHEEFSSPPLPDRLGRFTTDGAAITGGEILSVKFFINGMGSSGTFLFSGQPNGAKVLKIDFDGNLLEPIPAGNRPESGCCHEDMIFDGTHLYHAHWSDRIDKIDPITGNRVATYQQSEVVGMTFVGNTIWISKWSPRQVGTWDPITNTFTAKFNTPTNAGGLAYDAANGVLWVGLQGGWVKPYDLNGNSLGEGFQPFGAIPNTVDGLEFVPAAIEAKDDVSATNEDTALSIAAPGVLANDTGGTLTAELVATPEHGSVTLNADGSFTYVPNPNFNGVDTFFYVAKAGDQESNIATVTITVNPVNDPPFFDTIADQFVSPPVNEDQTVHITGIAPGPPNESGPGEFGQFVTLSSTSSNPSLVSVSESISVDGSDGTLTYRRMSSSTGTARITVTAQDNGGGTNTFTRTFDIVVGASGTVEANLTGFTPNPDADKPPTVQVTVTARPIDWDGNGVIDPGDCYRLFHPQTGRYNIVPSDADRSPEGPPWRVPTRNSAGVITDPGDTEEICDIARSFTADVDLGEWITRTGQVTTALDYVSLIRDLECLVDPAECVERLWTGTRPVGTINFTSGSGATVADVNKVTLHTVNKVGGQTIVSDAPIEGAIARVFNRNDPDFQNQKFGGTQKIGKNPGGSFYDDIFESSVGLIATCTTPDSGVCIATETQAGDYLVIVRFVDTVQHLVVYDGLPKGLRDFVNGVATKSFTIVKKLTNGNFQEYQAGSKTVVKPCGSTCP